MFPLMHYLLAPMTSLHSLLRQKWSSKLFKALLHQTFLPRVSQVNPNHPLYGMQILPAITYSIFDLCLEISNIHTANSGWIPVTGTGNLYSKIPQDTCFIFFHNLQPISYLFVIWLKTIMSLVLMIDVLYRTRKLGSHEWDQEWTTVYCQFESPGSCFFMQYFKIPIQKNGLYLWQCIQGHLYFKKLLFKLNSDIFDNKFYVSSHNVVFHSC